MMSSNSASRGSRSSVDDAMTKGWNTGYLQACCKDNNQAGAREGTGPQTAAKEHTDRHQNLDI